MQAAAVDLPPFPGRNLTAPPAPGNHKPGRSPCMVFVSETMKSRRLLDRLQSASAMRGTVAVKDSKIFFWHVVIRSIGLRYIA